MCAQRIASCALQLKKRSGLDTPMALRLAAAIVLALATLGTSCAKGHGKTANEESSNVQRAELDRLGFLDTGPLLVAPDGAEFRSEVRSGLTAVTVPSDVEFDEHGSWTIFPSMEGVYDFRFTRTVDDRHFYVALYLYDAEGDGQTFRWRMDAPRPEISDEINPNSDSVLVVTVYSGAPFVLGLPPVHAPDAGWHRAAIDAQGHLWIHPHAERAVALDTGEAVDTSAMREIGWWPARMPYEDFVTLCGTPPNCYVISKGGMYLPFSMAGEITCTPRSDGFSVMLSATEGDLTLEFDVGLYDNFGHITAGCAEVLQSRSLDGELPVAFAARAREASTGRALDLVASADGRLYVGHPTDHLRCPPCAVES